MNCKKIGDLISAYIDGELDNTLKRRVDEHLRACPRCRGLEERVRRAAVTPLRKTERIRTPEAVWQNIKKRLEEGEERISFPEFIGGLFINLRMRKPALALATAMITVLIVVLFLKAPFDGRDTVGIYVQEKAEFFYYLSGEDVNGYPDMYSAELGTDIEEYLL